MFTDAAAITNTALLTLDSFECLWENPIIESEEHVITECPRNHPLRSRISDIFKSLIMSKEYKLIMSSAHERNLGDLKVNAKQTATNFASDLLYFP